MPTEYSSTLLTTAELLTHVESDLASATLQRILDAEEEEIVKRFGSHAPDDSTDTSQTEKFYSVHGQKFIYLGREVASVTSVSETESNKYGETTTTLSANDFEIYDNKRLGYNPESRTFYINNQLSEQDETDADILSNGFRLTNTGSDGNGSGDTYVYLAFAHSPFVNSNGVPNNAR